MNYGDRGDFNGSGIAEYSYEPERTPMYYFKKIMFGWVIPIVVEIAIVMLLVKYVFFFVRVPTGSMIPTIEPGSILVTLRTHDPAKSIKRGDIVVFYSDELKTNLCKRVIGMPGDKVSIQGDGSIKINNWILHEPYVKNQFDYQQYYVNHTEFEVPEGHYVFMGDNRDNSDDARFWSQPYISADNIIGEAKFTLFPFNKFGMLK